MATQAADSLIIALSGKREGNSWRCECPVHPGQRHLSLTWRDDKLLVHCHVGASQSDIIAILQQRGLWDNGRNPAVGNQLIAEYRYIDPVIGEIVAIKGRFRKSDGSKTFAWRLVKQQDWSGLLGLKESALPLYNAHLLASHKGPAFVVEGEKAANACLDAGLLALCPPGGASSKDFGNQLTRLAGHDVVLWPDNDEAGRLLMRRIAAQLSGVAASVRTIAPTVPEKGDAHDYFEAGGDAEKLLDLLATQRMGAWLEEVEDGYQVYTPYESGMVTWRLTELERRGRMLDAEVQASANIPGLAMGKYGYSLNLNSASTCDSFRRGLDDRFPGMKGEWSRLFNEARQLVRTAMEETDRAMAIDDAPDIAGDLYLLPNLIMATGTTFLFGDGGSGKTMLALYLAVEMTRQGKRVLFMDYEASAAVIKRRVMRLGGKGLPIYYWSAGGIPLADQVSGLRARIARSGIDVVIVDSAAMACGMDPLKAEAATLFHNVIARLKIPALVIAHITKAGEDKWPLGTIMWHNCARLTWNVKVSDGEDSDVLHIGLFNRKPPSEDRKLKPRAYRFSFLSEEKIDVTPEDPRAEFVESMTLSVRIRDVLQHGPQPVSYLAAALNVSQATIRTTLSRIRDVHNLEPSLGKVGRWTLTAQEPEEEA